MSASSGILGFQPVVLWTDALLFLLVAVALAWMHLAVRRMEHAHNPQLAGLPAFPELDGLDGRSAR